MHMDDPPQQEEQGGWDVHIGIPITKTQQQLENELSEYASLCTYKLVLIQK